MGVSRRRERRSGGQSPGANRIAAGGSTRDRAMKSIVKRIHDGFYNRQEVLTEIAHRMLKTWRDD